MVRLVSLFSYHEVELAEIASVDCSGGFEIVLVSGRRIGTVALGDSVLGQITGHRRAHRVARRLERAVPGFGRSSAPNSWRQDSVEGRPRTVAVVTALLASVLLIVGYLAIAAVRGG